MLDDSNWTKNRDPYDALGVAAQQADQLRYEPNLINGETGFSPGNIVVAGMGGSALAADLAWSVWGHDIKVPYVTVRGYDLPGYVNADSLVIVSSYSGNTEETISCLEAALGVGAHVAVIASGGKLIERAAADNLVHIVLPEGLQPRMAVLDNLLSLARLFEVYGLQSGIVASLHADTQAVSDATRGWLPSVPEESNLAKQLANRILGTTPVVYGGQLTGSLAYKWKIGFNENAKNVAFTNTIPEFNHNEFIGWTSHPIEKPYTVIDLVSQFDHPRVLKRFAVSNKLLSGKRPAAITIDLEGSNPFEQVLWGSVLGDFVSIYLALLNGVDPTKVDLIEKLKAELA